MRIAAPPRRWLSAAVALAAVGVARPARGEPPPWSEPVELLAPSPEGPSPSQQGTPAVAAVGTGWLVTWLDGRTGSVSVWGQWLDEEARPEADNFEIAPNARGHAVANGPGGPVVVWTGPRGLQARTVSAAGLGPIHDIADGQTWCAVAADASGAAVVWRVEEDESWWLRGRLLDASGAPAGEELTLAGPEPVAALWLVGVAGLDDGFVAAWRGEAGLQAARISGEGELLDDTGIWVAPDVASSQAAVAGSGSAALLVWESEAGLVSARLGADGTSLDPVPRVLGSVPGRQLALTWGAEGGLLVRTDWDEGGGWVLPLSAAGEASGDPVEVVEGLESQDNIVNLAVAGRGQEALVAFEDAGDIVARRVGADGSGLGEPFVPPRSAAWRGAPVLVPGPTDTLLLYREGPSLRGVRLDPDRVVRDETPFDLPDPPSQFAVTWLGAAWGVVGVRGEHDCSYLYSGCEVLLWGVDAEGRVSTEREPLAHDVTDVAIASLGDGGPVVWSWREGGLGSVLVDAAGAPGEAQRLDLPGESPALSAGDDGYLLAWRSPGDGILLTVLGADGQRVDDVVGRLPGFSAPLAVVWTGEHWVVAWNEEGLPEAARVGRDGTPLDAAPTALPEIAPRSPLVLAPWGTDVVAAFRVLDLEARISAVAGLMLGPALELRDPVPWDIARPVPDLHVPGLAATPAGELLVVYSIFVDAPAVSAGQLRLRVAPADAAPRPDDDDGGDGDAGAGRPARGGVAGGGCGCHAAAEAGRGWALAAVLCWIGLAACARRRRRAGGASLGSAGVVSRH